MSVNEGTLEIELAGERVLLHPQRALFWPARSTLFIADPHFGKAAVFRRYGLSVPAGNSRDDLDRLTALVEGFGIERVLVLGDFFHARPHQGEPFFEALRHWRQKHRGLALEVVRGNHDRHAGDLLVDTLTWHDRDREEPPFVLRHEPIVHDAGYVLAGHLHPVARLRGAAQDSLRLPVFWFRRRIGVLPAFGTFTGGYRVTSAPGESLYAVTSEQVIAVPPSRRTPGSSWFRTDRT